MVSSLTLPADTVMFTYSMPRPVTVSGSSSGRGSIGSRMSRTRSSAGFLQFPEMVGGRLAAGHHVGLDLTGVGDPGDGGEEGSGHERSGKREEGRGKRDAGSPLRASRLPLSAMLRLAIAQMRPDKGAYRENLHRLGGIFREMAGWAEPPDLVVTPESALTGYFPRRRGAGPRAFLRAVFRGPQRAARGRGRASARCRRSGSTKSGAIPSTTRPSTPRWAAPRPGIRHVHRKVFLPTYGVFDEERFVEPGMSVRAFDTRWGRAAMLVCEDAWHSLMPTLAALDGAQLDHRAQRHARPGPGPGGRGAPPGQPGALGTAGAGGVAEEHGVFVVVAQLVGFEGGKGFAGGSIVAGAPRPDPGRGPDLRARRGDSGSRPGRDHPGPGRFAAAVRSGAPLAPSDRRRSTDGRRGRRADGRAGNPGHALSPDPPVRQFARAGLRSRSPSTASSPAGGWWSSSGTRSAAARVREGGDRALGRGGQRGRRLPGRRGAGAGERDGGPDALPDVESRRAWSTPTWSSTSSACESRTVDISARGGCAGLRGRRRDRSRPAAGT